jgi:uncharacterized protein YbjQ (UPF0145 family)
MKTVHNAKSRSLIISGLGGDEAFCLRLAGLKPGHLLVGNSVQSLGFLGSLSAGLRNLAGGESADITAAIKNGRDAAIERLMIESRQVEAHGVSGVNSELRSFDAQIEFISTGSAVNCDTPGPHFTSSFDGKELFCAIDAGFAPRKFAFGNIAYSIGVGGGLLGGLKTLVRGEIKEFSNVLNATRHKALERISRDAAAAGANAVLGIEVDVMPFGGFHEMLLTGTACHHPGLPQGQVATCDLMCDELWSMAKMGYAPVRLVMGTAVYSLGLVGGFMAAMRGLSRGEIPELTSMVYEAREHALDLLESDAKSCGADMVLGTDVYIHEMANGLVEFMAIGTAVKKNGAISCASPALPAQATAIHRRTFRKSLDNMIAGGSVSN